MARSYLINGKGGDRTDSARTAGGVFSPFLGTEPFRYLVLGSKLGIYEMTSTAHCSDIGPCGLSGSWICFLRRCARETTRVRQVRHSKSKPTGSTSSQPAIVSPLGNLSFLLGEYLAGVHDPIGIGQPLYLAHEEHRVAVLFLEMLRLAGTYPVLPGARAATLEGVADYFAVDLLGRLELRLVCVVHREGGVVVAVADVPQDGSVEAASVDGLARLPKRPGQLGDRDAHVGRHQLLARVEIFYGKGGLVADLPQLLPPLLVLLKLERFALLELRDLACRRHVTLDGGLGAAELQKEGRGDGILRALVGVERLDGAGVDQLDAPDLHSGANHGDRSPTRRLYP